MDDNCQRKIYLVLMVFVCLVLAAFVGMFTGIVVEAFAGPDAGLRACLIVGLVAWLISLIVMLKDYYYRFYANWPDFRM